MYSHTYNACTHYKHVCIHIPTGGSRFFMLSLEPNTSPEADNFACFRNAALAFIGSTGVEACARYDEMINERDNFFGPLLPL